jgi:hypothetical protein
VAKRELVWWLIFHATASIPKNLAHHFILCDRFQRYVQVLFMRLVSIGVKGLSRIEPAVLGALISIDSQRHVQQFLRLKGRVRFSFNPADKSKVFEVSCGPLRRDLIRIARDLSEAAESGGHRP